MPLDELIQQARQLLQAGNSAEAEAIGRQILAEQPDYPDGFRLLSVIAHQRGQHTVAVQHLRRAVELAPSRADYQFDLGHLLMEAGQLETAIACLRQATARQPDWAAAHNKLGNLLFMTGRYKEAIAAYERTIELQANHAEALNNLGVALCMERRHGEAIEACRKALALRPDWAEAQYHLGVALGGAGQLEAAIEPFRRALALRPDYREALFDLASAHKALGQMDQAIAVFSQGVAARPNWPQAHNAMGITYMWVGELDKAIACFNRALALAPQDHIADSNRVFLLQFHPDYDSQAILRENKLWDQRHGEPLRSKIVPHANDRSVGRPLRIGYVSPNFCAHSQAPFIYPLLRDHDHSQFHVYCYSGVLAPDTITAKMQTCAEEWREITALADAAVVEMVRADKIDILVDLTLHMALGRPLVFARKPAPIQVAWLAYPGTTGMAAMDYRFTDALLDPPGASDADYVERCARLPGTFACFDSDALADSLPLTPLPALANGFVTFGALHNFFKLNPPLIALWGRVLVAVPGSRLRLLAPEGSVRERIVQVITGAGVEAGRVEFLSRLPRKEYLAEFSRIDICLDTLPYNGHTTTLDSLWSGVPVVTRVGRTAAGRAGWSVLNNLRLPELAAHDDAEFVRISAGLAGDLPRLAERRRTMRQRMSASPVMDAPLFARNVEAAYQQIWKAFIL
jgi:protein O-GlcNAc transferase